jgi:hypothetical protein
VCRFVRATLDRIVSRFEGAITDQDSLGRSRPSGPERSPSSGGATSIRSWRGASTLTAEAFPENEEPSFAPRFGSQWYFRIFIAMRISSAVLRAPMRSMTQARWFSTVLGLILS